MTKTEPNDGSDTQPTTDLAAALETAITEAERQTEHGRTKSASPRREQSSTWLNFSRSGVGSTASVSGIHVKCPAQEHGGCAGEGHVAGEVCPLCQGTGKTWTDGGLELLRLLRSKLCLTVKQPEAREVAVQA